MANDRRTVVVNMFGGPGAGKTNAAWDVASELKKRGYVVEYVPEYAKELVWQKEFHRLDGSRQNQQEILRAQQRRLDILNGQVDFIVTDSPLPLNYIYFNPKGDGKADQEYRKDVFDRFSRFTNFNVFIQRGTGFEQAGRIHDLAQSKEKDAQIKELLDAERVYYGVYSRANLGKIADNCITTFNRINARQHSQAESTPPTLDELMDELLKKCKRSSRPMWSS